MINVKKKKKNRIQKCLCCIIPTMCVEGREEEGREEKRRKGSEGSISKC